MHTGSGVGCSGEGVGEISGGDVLVGLLLGVIVMKGSLVGVDDGIRSGDNLVGVCVPAANAEFDGEVHCAGRWILVALGSTGDVSVGASEHAAIRSTNRKMRNTKTFMSTSQEKTFKQEIHRSRKHYNDELDDYLYYLDKNCYANMSCSWGVFQESWQIAHAQMVIMVSKDDNDPKMSCSQLFV
jgi:hypothetical protein